MQDSQGIVDLLDQAGVPLPHPNSNPVSRVLGGGDQLVIVVVCEVGGVVAGVDRPLKSPVSGPGP